MNPYKINIQQQITEAFHAFAENGKIHLKNVAEVARALGCVPRNAEIKELLKQVEDPIEKGFVKLETLLPVLTDIIIKDKWKPASRDEILEAFEFFDTKRKGYLSPDYMKNLLTKQGDKLDENEVKKFLETVVNPLTGQIEYKKCYEKFVVPDAVDILDNKRKLLRDLLHENI